jgi:predicted Zn-dependent protease
VLPLAPVLNVWAMSTQTLVAARYLYLPLLGLGAVAARLGLRAVTAERAVRRAALGAFGLVAAACAGVALVQQAELRDDDALWSWEHAVAPDNPHAAKVLARLRMEQGRPEEALELIGRAYARVPGQPAEQAALVLLAAETVLASTSDADQATLASVRDFFDQAAAGRRVRLRAAGLELELAGDGGPRPRFLDDVAKFRIPRAVAHARALDLEGAVGLLREVTADEPRSVAAWANLGQVLARIGRWDEADEAVRRGLLAKPDDGFLAELGRRIGQARAREGAAAGEEPFVRGLARAESAIEFGGVALARTILDPLIEARPDDPRPVLLRLRADVVDGRFELARGVIEAAWRRAPGHARLWDELWEKLAAEELRRELGGGREGGEGGIRPNH